ncbi:unnamed protein product [Brassica oleracea var. botrytis]
MFYVFLHVFKNSLDMGIGFVFWHLRTMICVLLLHKVVHELQLHKVAICLFSLASSNLAYL